MISRAQTLSIYVSIPRPPDVHSVNVKSSLEDDLRAVNDAWGFLTRYAQFMADQPEAEGVSPYHIVISALILAPHFFLYFDELISTLVTSVKKMQFYKTRLPSTQFHGDRRTGLISYLDSRGRPADRLPAYAFSRSHIPRINLNFFTSQRNSFGHISAHSPESPNVFDLVNEYGSRRPMEPVPIGQIDTK